MNKYIAIHRHLFLVLTIGRTGICRAGVLRRSPSVRPTVMVFASHISGAHYNRP
jgi:hypothetical protein